MVDVVILTKSQLRHQFVRKAIALDDDINILRTSCESTDGTTLDRVREEGDEVKLRHLEACAETENNFFDHFVDCTPDRSSPPWSRHTRRLRMFNHRKYPFLRV